MERKREKGAPTFVAEFPIQFSPGQRKKAGARFHCGTALYNACLREAMERLKVTRVDPRWAKAREMPKTVGKKPDGTLQPNLERRALFHEVQKATGFTAWSMGSFGSSLRVGWMREGVPAHEAKKIGEQAYGAAERWLYKFRCGKRGRPRFKALARGLHSMATKDGHGAIKVKETGPTGLSCQWTRDCIAPLDVRDNPVHRHAVEAIRSDKVLFCRIVRRKIKGRWYYHLQVVLDGHHLQRYEAGTGVVGMDLGPSVAAIVTDDAPHLEQFCAGLERNEAELRRQQRHLDRQHRAGSPECFDDRGRHLPGRCHWSRSKRAVQTVVAVQEAHRTKAEHRKSLHGNLAHRVLGQGSHVHVEKLNKVAWQKIYGRSVSFRAPGMFETLLTHKAESAGGSVTLIDAWKAKLSQLCVCGSISKKPLSQRAHVCECGVREQRDLWSAYLARHTDAGGAVDLVSAQTELGMRHDVGAGRGAIEPNLQVPRALLRAPEYASGRAGRLRLAITGPMPAVTPERHRGGPNHRGL